MNDKQDVAPDSTAARVARLLAQIGRQLPSREQTRSSAEFAGSDRRAQALMQQALTRSGEMVMFSRKIRDEQCVIHSWP
jgi:hypothetical protein